jgi:hypothetical protein
MPSSRRAFARDYRRTPTGHSDINHQKGIVHSKFCNVEYLCRRFETIPLSERDPRIEKALDLVEGAPPSSQHFIEYMIVNVRMGFKGSEVSQEILCDTLRRCTGAKRFGVRTLRNAAKWAELAGFIVAEWIPIGKRVSIENGREWRTKRIRRYTATYKIELLASILRTRTAPKLAIVSDNDLHDPTSEKSSHNPNGKLSGEVLRTSPEKLNRLCPIKEESPCGDESTCPSRPQAPSSTCEHQSSTPSAGSRRRRRPKGSAVRFGRERRLATPTAYRRARAQFLHELWVYLKPETAGALANAFELYRIAELQTDPFYPKYLPAALDWYDLLLPMYFAPWHERRRAINLDIAPALKKFAAAWTRPESGSAPEHVENWSMSLCPEPGISVRPAYLREYFRLWPFVRSHLSTIHEGRAKFAVDALRDRASPIFQFCRLFFA